MSSVCAGVPWSGPHSPAPEAAGVETDSYTRDVSNPRPEAAWRPRGRNRAGPAGWEGASRRGAGTGGGARLGGVGGSRSRAAPRRFLVMMGVLFCCGAGFFIRRRVNPPPLTDEPAFSVSYTPQPAAPAPGQPPRPCAPRPRPRAARPPRASFPPARLRAEKAQGAGRGVLADPARESVPRVPCAGPRSSHLRTACPRPFPLETLSREFLRRNRQ